MAQKKTAYTKQEEQLFRLIVVTGIALAIALLSLIGSCSDGCPKRDTIEIVIQVDLTEAQLAKPDADEIIRLYRLDTNKWNAASLTYGDLTDVSYNRYTSFVLAPGGNRLTSSSFTRDREVKTFEDSIRSFLSERAADTTGRPHSSIYLPLAAELTRLSQSDATRKMLLVYSDLMQNDPSFSFYDQHTMATLKNDPQSITAMLEAKTALPDLAGIDVYLIFQPADAAQDETFQLVSGFYKALLESHNATVHIGANAAIL